MTDARPKMPRTQLGQAVMQVKLAIGRLEVAMEREQLDAQTAKRLDRAVVLVKTGVKVAKRAARRAARADRKPLLRSVAND